MMVKLSEVLTSLEDNRPSFVVKLLDLDVDSSLKRKIGSADAANTEVNQLLRNREENGAPLNE